MDVKVNLLDIPADKRVEIYKEILRLYPHDPTIAGEIYFMRRYSALLVHNSTYIFPNLEKYTEWALTWM